MRASLLINYAEGQLCEGVSTSTSTIVAGVYVEDADISLIENIEEDWVRKHENNTLE